MPPIPRRSVVRVVSNQQRTRDSFARERHGGGARMRAGGSFRRVCTPPNCPTEVLMALETSPPPVPAPEFKPYVPDGTALPEFTPRAVILGMIFGIIFGAVTVYVGLRAGLTVAASIPIAVLSLSLLRALGR